jgi:spectinomycin phosphotransferase
MLEKLELSDKVICQHIQREYGLDVGYITFLPLGYDTQSAVYKVTSRDNQSYFLKLRSGEFAPVAVSLPRYLRTRGIQAVIPPLATLHGRLFGQIDTFTCVLYPFIQGRDGYEVRLNDGHWISLGKTLRMIHETQLPEDLAHLIPHDAYDSFWRDSTLDFLAYIESTAFTETVAHNLAAFLLANRDLIGYIVERANNLAAVLRSRPEDLVLCHSDAHPGNYLVADSGDLYLVDWDSPIFAPREHDLMCIGGGMSGDQSGGREESLFYQGYGPVAINPTALAYYRYERVVQDIAEFCKQIFLTNPGGADRAQSYQYLVSSFQPANVVVAALQTDADTILKG